MKRIIALAMVASLLLVSFPTVLAREEKISVIIGFKGKPDLALIQGLGGDIEREYNLINAVAAELPTQAIEALSRNPKIAYIEEDARLSALGEVLPWGVDRIDAELVHPYNEGTGIKIAIIDTGIDYDHPDLDANYKGGYDFVNGDSDPMDDEGHGTHVAGIVAAELGNGIGVIGVAPEAYLYAVKVLDSSGSGYLSDVIAGIEWAVNNGMQIASMSLGTSTDYQSLHDACDVAYAAGVLLVAAAGNDGNPPGKGANVGYPAAYSSVIAVGATDDEDSRARWSSTGAELELMAPGVNIYSTYWDDTYATLSGTSMACPHVTGTAALVFASSVDPTYDSDGDGQWDASEVRQRLIDTAEDLGDPGWDSKYGYGLVDAYAAAPEPTEPVHDVAITDISAPSWAVQGDLVSVDVTAANLGDFDENFMVTLTDTTDNIEIGSQAVSLAAGTSTTLTFSWDTTSATIGDHILEATASTVPEETDTTNNSKTTTVAIKEPVHDVAVTAIDAPTQVALGDVSTIDVTVSNEGTYSESFTVTLTDTTDGVEIGSQAISLAAGDSTTLSFSWDTTGASVGDHVLEAQASVVEGETNTSNNVKTATVSVVEAQTLDVAVSTDKSTYSSPAWAEITVEVTSGGSPVEGAAVDVTVYYPDGSVSATGSGTTDSSGVAAFRYRIGPKDPAGTYNVEAVASKSGYTTGSGSTTFSVESGNGTQL